MGRGMDFCWYSTQAQLSMKTRLKSLDPDLSTRAQSIPEPIKNGNSQLLMVLVSAGDSFKEIFPSAHTSEYIYSFILCPISKKNGETGRSSGSTVPRLKMHQLSFPIVRICGLWIAVGCLPELFSLLPILNDRTKYQKFSRRFAKLSTYITMELKPKLKSKKCPSLHPGWHPFSIHHGAGISRGDRG